MLSLRLKITVCAVVLSSYTSAQLPDLNSNPVAAAAVFLDFDGHIVKGTGWNWDSTIGARPASLSSPVITEIFERVAEDFRIFNINITTDSAVFNNAPPGKRMRIICTPTHHWYGTAAGVSFVNSFTWGDDTPAWVFTNLLENNPKYIAEATSHEIGHTLGLQHQSTYGRDCHMVREYSEGQGGGEIGSAPIMGVGYFKNLTLWTVGSSSEGCSVIQNDINIISRGFNEIGMRKDDHSNSRSSASALILTNEKFGAFGIINNASDVDFFRFTIDRRVKFTARVTPHSAGAGNSGANIDILAVLVNGKGDTIGKYNPKLLLHTLTDTTLLPGTYYIGIDGTGNQNVSDYGSVGLYSLTGSIENIAIAPTVLLRGDVRGNVNVLKWDYLTGPQVRSTYIEYSLNGLHYFPFADAGAVANSYEHQSPGNQPIFYRVRVVLDDESTSFSNVLQLSNRAGSPVVLMNNPVRDAAQVRSSGTYSYQLLDETGRLLDKGTLTDGINEIPLRTLRRGLVLLKVFNKTHQFHYRIIKQ